MDEFDFDAFEEEAQYITEFSPDVDSGLEVLKDLYSSVPENSRAEAKDVFLNYSTEVRRKFDDTKPFDYQTTIDLAPLGIDDIVSDKEDPEENKLDRLNKWEEENLKLLQETDDPTYMQMQSQLSRSIKQIASIEKRDIYGSDNYLITDLTLRAGQGLVGGIASLVGADSVNDWFTENTNPENDDSYWSAIASGVGSATGAIASGIATGGPGALVYLGASGAGSVREMYETSKENEATTGEALLAAGIESASQIGQAYVGGRIFGSVSKKILGKTATEALEKTMDKAGPRLFAKPVQAGLAEGTTEGVGQVVSNVAANVGNQDVDIFENWKQNFVAGFVVGGGATYAGNKIESLRQSKEPEQVTGEAAFTEEVETPAGAMSEEVANPFTEEPVTQGPIENPFVEEAQGETFKIDTETGNIIKEAQETVTQIDGYEAPKSERLPLERNSVVLDSYATLTPLSDGTEIVASEGRIHLKAGDHILQSFDSTYLVEPEVKEKLQALTAPGVGNPDATAITISTEDGKLYVNSEFVNDDLTISSEKTGKTRVEVPTTQTGDNLGVVFADSSKIKHMKFNEGTEQAVITDGFYIPKGTVSTTGAAHISEFFKGKESYYIKKMREQYGDLTMVEQGILEDGYEYITNEGETATTKPWSPYSRETVSLEDTAKQAVELVREKGGVFSTLDYLNSLSQANARDTAAAIWVQHTMESAYIKALQTNDTAEATKYRELYAEAVRTRDFIASLSGSSQRVLREDSQRLIAGMTEGDAEVLKITHDIRRTALKAANAELGGDPAKEADIVALTQELTKAREEIAVLKQQIADPVEQELIALDEEVKAISDSLDKKEFTDKIQAYQEDIKQLERQEEVELQDINNQLSDADKQIKQALEDTKKEIDKVTEEIAVQTSLPLEPTKQQIDRQIQINDRLAKLEKQKQEYQKKVESISPNTFTDQKIELYKKTQNETIKALEEVENKIQETAETRQSLLKEMEGRLKENKEPTKQQLDRQKALEERLAKLDQKRNTYEQTLNTEPDLSLTDKEQESYNKKRAQAEAELAAINTKIQEALQAKEQLKNEVATRVSTKREPTSEQSKKLSKLYSNMNNLLKQFGDIKQVNPKKSAKVKQIRSLNAERKKAIRSLKKQQKTTVREQTPRQRSLLKRKAELITAKEQGAIKVPKELKEKLIAAERVAKQKEAAILKIEQRIKDADSRIPEEAKAQLVTLFNERAKMVNPSPSEWHKINEGIEKILLKHLPATPDNLDYINRMWRRNVLSGPNTLFRDASYNFNLGLLEYIGYIGSQGLPTANKYLLGRLYGLPRGLKESKEILKGNRSGRITFSEDGAFKPLKMSIWPFAGEGKGWFINEFMQRVRAANDSLFYRSAEEGRAFVAAYKMAKAKKIPKEQFNDFMEEALYGTKTAQASIREEIEKSAEALKSVGIKMTPVEKELAFFERMEANRDEVVRALSQRHAERSVLIQDPEGFIGYLADGIIKMSKDTESTIVHRGIPIPIARDGKGKFVRWYPLKHMSNFVRVAANVSASLMKVTPIGYFEYNRLKNAPVTLNGKPVMVDQIIDGEIQLDENGNPKKVPLTDDTDAKVVASLSVMGTATLLTGLSLIASQLEEEDPYIQFYGTIPRGKYKEWKEKKIQEFSMRIGDNSYNLRGTPLMILASILGAADVALRAGESLPNVFMKSVLGGAAATANLSFLKTSGELFSLLSGGDENTFIGSGTERSDYMWMNKLKTIVSNEISGYIPSIGFLRNMGNWINTYVPDTFNEFEAKLLGRMPYSIELGITKPALNWFGEPIKKTFEERSGLDLWFTNAPTDPVNLWLKQSGFTLTPPPSIVNMTPTDVIRIGEFQQAKTGYKDILDAEQSRRVLEISGPEIKGYLTTLMADPNYQKVTPEKQKEINAVVSKIRARAKYDVLYGLK